MLIIEDEENLRLTIRKSLSRAGHECAEAATLAEARAHLTSSEFDLILTDISLGAENGLELVKEVRTDGYDGVIVVMTAFSSVENAVTAMRIGADDYLQKPLSLAELSLQVEKWLEHRRLARRVQLYERLEQSRDRDNEAVGESPNWKATLALGSRLAAIPLASDSTDIAGPGSSHPSPLPCILLMGETGAGKGVLARYIHAQAEAHAARANAGKTTPTPFVHVNCSAFPANLVEGELFGHEKGAFTDAREARPGLFEMADGGTIFLDEISEMPMDLQSKLLLVVESGRFRRVGGTKERSVRLRIVAASNQNLEARVKDGAFRRDLLYRLNAFTIKIPSLRERGNDAVLIAEAAIDRLARRYARPPMKLSAEAKAAVLSHDWPGNVRELVNAAQRAVMLGESATIDPADLGLTSPGHGAELDELSSVIHDSESDHDGHHNGHGVPHALGTSGSSLAMAHPQSSITFDFEHGVHTAAGVEKELIMQALRHTQGNVSRAARLIGMQRSSLRYRIDRYGLESYVVEVANR